MQGSALFMNAVGQQLAGFRGGLSSGRRQALAEATHRPLELDAASLEHIRALLLILIAATMTVLFSRWSWAVRSVTFCSSARLSERS